jgi:arylsulfatase A-like enzyme
VILTGNAAGGTSDYAPALIHEKALEFLEQNKDTTFFLFYPTTIPHAELAVEERYAEPFRGKLLPEKIYNGVDDGPNYRKGPYGSQKESHAVFAGMVTRLDEMVGEIVKKVNDLGLAEETIIIFTSDNGPHLEGGADPDYFNSNGGLRGYKRDVYEGGIRVPMIVRWPGHIAPKATSDHVSAFWDVMPTLAELIGSNEQFNTDGISFLPSLLGKSEAQKQHEFLYWEFHEQKGRLALRQGDWKLVQYNVNAEQQGKYELYNLKSDPQEKNNVIDQQPDLSNKMIAFMKEQRVPSSVFQF